MVKQYVELRHSEVPFMPYIHFGGSMLVYEKLYTCSTVDGRLPDLERFRSEKLYAWHQEHPSIRTFHFNQEVRTTHLVLRHNPMTLRMITVFIIYEQEGAQQ